MVMLSPTALQFMGEQKLREVGAEFERLRLEAELAPPGPGPRGALASALVRWGLRLDPSAGQRLATLELASVPAKRGRRS